MMIGILLSGMLVGWVPNATECLVEYNKCLRTAGRDCNAKRKECNYRVRGMTPEEIAEEEGVSPAPAPAVKAPEKAAEKIAEDGWPEGWKLAQMPAKKTCAHAKKLAQEDRLQVFGDFDGDGKPDTARVLAKAAGRTLALWILLAAEKTARMVATVDVADSSHDLGLLLVKAGTYKTGCGRGAWKCDEAAGETAALEVKGTALDFFSCRGASRYVAWNEAARDFKAIWMSE